MARTDAPARRLSTIPGIGTINAIALAAAVGDAEAFARGRDMAAWLGLKPAQEPDPWRSAAPRRARHAPRQRGAGSVATGAQECCRGGTGNKLARIAWAVLAQGRAYEPTMEGPRLTAGREMTAESKLPP